MKKETKSNPLKDLIEKYHKHLVLEMINELKIKGCDQKALIEKYKNKLPPGMNEELELLENGG